MCLHPSPVQLESSNSLFFFLSVFIEFVNNVASVYFCSFGHKACGILVPWPGIEPAPPALEGQVLTTGPAGKSFI